MRHTENYNENGRCRFYHINNDNKCECVRQFKQKAEMIRLDLKNTAICYLKKTFRFKETNGLKIK